MWLANASCGGWPRWQRRRPSRCASMLPSRSTRHPAWRGISVLRLGGLVEIEVGMERCGIAPGRDAASLARRVADASNLKFRGLQAYHGRAQHMTTHQERAQAIPFAVDAVRETLEALAAENLPCEIIGGAGTGTFAIEAASGVYNELQVGSYVFMDTEYARIRGSDGGRYAEFEHICLCSRQLS